MTGRFGRYRGEAGITRPSQFGHLKRREFIALAGGAVAIGPFAAARAQPTIPVIGVLYVGFPESLADWTAAFHAGLKQLGFVEGHNVAIEYRFAKGQSDRLPTLAADLVHRQVNVIVAVALGSARAAKAATQTIPIAFTVGGDPVKLGLVASFDRPASNITGIASLNNALVTKQLDILHELVPTAATIAMLVDPGNPNAADDVTDAQAAAQKLGLQLMVLNASNLDETEAAFAAMVKQHAGAALVGIDAFVGRFPDYIIPLAARHAIPAIYVWSEHAVAGGLISYGADQNENYRQLGAYTGKILRGVKPGDLPVWQAVKVEMVINLKTAKLLGLAIPLPLLGRADEVIE
jgi:putative tryptophan/tyrosine transport system substrate-binding protein